MESLPKFVYRPDRIVPSIANLLNDQLWKQEMGDVGESEEEERPH